MYVNNQLFLWLGAGFTVAAIIALLFTPREKKSRMTHSASLQQRLENYPHSAQAVIIRANRKASLLKALPWILVMILFSAYSIWFQRLEQPQCVEVFGRNAIRVQLLQVCYGLPLAALVWSLLFIRTGIKTLRTGYFPPLDARLYSDTIATRGLASTVKGVLILLMPLISAVTLYFGHEAYTTLMDGIDWQQTKERCYGEPGG